MKMHNPPHPMGIIREDVLPELNLTVTEAAEQLGISRAMFSRLLNEKASITPTMAIRLHQWLGRGPTPDVWLKMQADYDLWQLEQQNKDFNVTPIQYSNNSVFA